MRRSFRKYVILASILAVLWVGFLTYVYVNFTSQSDVISSEILNNSRRIGEQVTQMFSWFDARGKVYVTNADAGSNLLSESARSTTLGGTPLTLAIPIEVIKKLKNEFSSGIEVRFVSNSPKNINNLPIAEDNEAIMSMVSSGKQDAFRFRESEGLYHYTRPLFASQSCLNCHIDVGVGGLMGAIVIDTNPRKYVLSQRSKRTYILLICLVGSSIAIFAFYLFMLRIWRKHMTQERNLEYTQAMVESMSHGVEVIAGNTSRILKELGQGNTDPTKAELIRTLQYMSKDLLQTSSALNSQGGEGTVESKEELIHVDTFFRQCVQIFHPKCQEKEISLSLHIESDTPEHVMGDAFHLRQIISMLIKNAVTNTDSGGVSVRVRASIHMASRISIKDLDHIPIHLVIDVEDTGKGVILTDQQHILQKFSSRKDGATFGGKAVVNMNAISEIAAFLNGSVTLPANSKTGSCFVTTVQVKMVDEGDIASEQKRPVQTAPVQSTLVQRVPVPNQTQHASQMQGHSAKEVEEAKQYMEKVRDKASRIEAGHALIARHARGPSEQASQASQGVQTPQTQEGLQTSQVQAHNEEHVAVASAAPNLPEMQARPEDKQKEPISVIIGDSGISSFTPQIQTVWDQESFDVDLMSNADEIFEALDTPKHKYSVLLLRELVDMDIIYVATRIRYLEQLGSKPVAIILMAEDIVQADMDVLRHFNISTVDNFPRDPHIATKVIRLALRTQGQKIFQGGKLLDKTDVESNTTQIFDMEKAIENSKKDKKFVQSMCHMWIRFYPEQLRRLQIIAKKGTQDEKLRILRAMNNSAATVCLPMLWAETKRLEDKILKGEEDVRFEKLFSVFEQTLIFLKKKMAEEA